MQRMILRTTFSLIMSCLLYLVPTKINANPIDYGPEMDPIISETLKEVSLTCPNPITVDCDDNGIYQTYIEFTAAGGSVNLPDGCVVDSFTFVSDTEISQDGCSFVYSRTYFITESCGNTFTCNQIVMQEDDDVPFIISCAADTILEVSMGTCQVAYVVPEISATDGCTDVTITNNSPGTFDYGVTVVTYTATDECGNSSSCSITVSVEDNSPLTVNCPSDINDNTVCDISGVPPYADFAAFMAAGGSVTGNCGAMGGATYTITDIQDVELGGSCPKTVNRTYTISDDQNNEGSCTQLISIIDDTPPTLVVPVDIDVDCALAADTSITGSPTMIMDNCDTLPLVSFFDGLSMGGMCEGEGSFVRSWVVTDICMNADTFYQTITTVDTTAPNAICKDSLDLYLDINGDVLVVAADLDNGSSDACSNLSFSASLTFLSCNEVNIPQMVDLTVSDDCNNMSTCTVIVTARDSFPVILVGPTNDTLTCQSDVPLPFADFDEFETMSDGYVEDNCVSNNSFTLLSADTTGTCSILIERIYQYTDQSGNSDTALHSIYVIDTIAPMITMCPSDISISELDICDTLLTFGLPLVSDNCGGLTITNDYTNNGDSTATFSGGTTKINFTVVDVCGNQDTCSMTVIVDAPPVISCPDLEIIDSADDLPDYPTLMSFVEAGGIVNAFCAIDDTTFMYNAEFDIEIGGCSAIVTETVSVSDTFGNPFIVTKQTMVMDTLAPTLSGCGPKFVVVNHQDCTIDTTFTLPTAMDNYGVDTTYLSLGAFVNDTAQAVFYAQDLCGTLDSCSFNVVVIDPTSPDIDIDDITIMCDTMNAAPIYTTVEEFVAAPGGMVYDCRLDSASFMHMGDVVNGNIIMRTYSISDFSGQTGTTVQSITIIDGTPPEILTCTPDTAVFAASDTCGMVVALSAPTYEDNCGGSISLVNNYNGTDDASGFYPVGVTVVIWTITDGNGLTDTCSFSVTVEDNLSPSISCPSDTSIFCDIAAYPAFETIEAFEMGGGSVSDNCDIVDFSHATLSSGVNEFERTYTVTDASGLMSDCVQTITVFDTIAPTISCVSVIIVNSHPDSCSKFLVIEAPNATDDCDNDVNVYNSINGQASISAEFSDTTNITWYAEDDFGNIDSCSYDIIINDATGPVVSDPPIEHIMCVEMLASIDTFETVQDLVDAGGSATDNCGIEFVNFISENAISSDTIERIYAVIDSSGNSSSVTQTIVINDTTAPEFEAPDDVTIDCDADAEDLSITGTVDSTMLMDNCMDIDTLIYVDEVQFGSCPVILEISRIWVLSDNSGNETRDTQLIITVDTIPPVFDSEPEMIDDIACDQDFPPQEVLTATDACSGANVFMDTLPYVENICMGYVVTYRWIAEDGCMNRDTITQQFSVLPDTSAPELITPNNVTVESEADVCGIRIANVIIPEFEEDCSNFDLTNDYTDTIYHVGLNIVNWTATNSCGLDSTVTQEITVVDNIPPTIHCKDATAGITSDPQNNVPATSFIADITDNCNIDSVLVRRYVDECGTGSDQFSDSIHICCADVETFVDVEIKVVDASGNVNYCDAQLFVEDNRLPMLVEALPNIVISCSFVFDTLDMDVFGSYTNDPDNREEIRIEDVFYEDQDSIAGIDGLVSDECDVTISDSTIVNLDICNQGFIRRIFTVTDLSGNSIMLEQLIEIQDVSPFNENGDDILWPANFIWNQCANPAPDTTISGSPQFLNDDKCALVAASFKDQLFNYPPTSCPFIKRKWKVIDWCQYDDSVDPNPGLWTYEQFILVQNNVPPTILSTCQDTLICAPNNECSAIVSLSLVAEDDCNADSQFLQYGYSINLNNDANPSNDIKGTTSSFTLEIEGGIHTVSWFVEDRCGNTTECSYLLTVKECKAPTPVCLNGLALNLGQDGTVDLWASDVNQSSSDNCTGAEDLIYSFSQDIADFGLTFDCDDLQDPQYIEMWVTDEDGNQSFCSSFVDIQDNGGYCDNINGSSNPNQLKGMIVTENNIAIPEAMVSIIGAEMDDDYMTPETGEYSFENIDFENDYKVNVERDKDYVEGVSTLDLVLIQRHILGLDQFNSPYKLIAADINDSEHVTASDLLALRKLILGIDEKFEHNTSWRFVSKNEQFEDQTDPWPIPESLIIQDGSGSQYEADFVGIKIGDVNNTIDNLINPLISQNRNNEVFGLVVKDEFVRSTSEIDVDFVSASDIDLLALQTTIRWDVNTLNFIDIEALSLPLENAFINRGKASEGILTIAWSSVDKISLTQGLPLFQLKFEGKDDGYLSGVLEINSKITEALAYDSKLVEHDLELAFTESNSKDLVLYQNKPNPFMRETVIEFNLPEDMEVTLKIFNGEGRMLHSQTSEFHHGLNSVKLGEEFGSYRGILFLKMETAEFSDVKKMIRIE